MIFNRYTKSAIFWTFISILMKASSTVWLSQILNGGSIFLNLSLLIGSYILSSVPDIIVTRKVEEAELEAARVYVDKFLVNQQDLPQLILDATFRKKQEPWLTSENRRVIKESQTVIFSSISGITSILIDATIMSLFVNPVYVAGYAGSAILYFSAMKYSKNKIETYSIKTLNSNKSLTNILLSAWDNIVIGNKYNLRLWLNKFQNLFSLTKQSTIQYVQYIKISGFIGTMVASLPILAVTVILFQKNSGDLNKIALLLAVLPRQMQTIQFLNMLSSSFTKWSGVKKQLSALSESVEDPFKDHPEPNYKIYWEKLSFTNGQNPIYFRSIDDFLSKISMKRNGRITIRGDNGFGKSVLMCKLHDHLLKQGLSTFYLPCNAQLSFESLIEQMSSGEKIKAKIAEIRKNINAQFILLDEWDANLDSDNVKKISNELSNLSENQCLVEVRHRNDNDSVDKKIDIEQKSNIASSNLLVQKNDPYLLVSFSNKKNTLPDHMISLITEEPPTQQDNNLNVQLLKSSYLRDL